MIVTQRYVLALDQGTTSSRAIVFGRDGRVVSVAQREFPQIFPSPGTSSTIPRRSGRRSSTVAREALATAGITASDIAAIGVTNQRETTILWDTQTGRPVAQRDRLAEPGQRAASAIALKADGHEALFRRKTGLVVDAYFSGTKIKHLLDTIPGLRARAERGRDPVRHRRHVPASGG